jgi:hypothetical protein
MEGTLGTIHLVGWGLLLGGGYLFIRLVRAIIRKLER